MKIDDTVLEIPYDKQMDYINKTFGKTEGGSGSGNAGHSGIIGHQGGSLPKGVKNPISNIGKRLGGLAPNQGQDQNPDMTAAAKAAYIQKAPEPDLDKLIGNLEVDGGSTVIDMSKYSDDFSKITLSERMAQADYKDIVSQMAADLQAAREGEQPAIEEVKGEMNDENLQTIINNGQELLDTARGYLTEECYNMAQGVLNDMEDIFKSEEFKDKKAEDIDKFVQATMDKLIYQEVESNRRQFLDHGIRHIVSDYERSVEIMEHFVGRELTPMERLMNLTIMSNHDVGYTTPLVRLGGDRMVPSSDEHQLYSEKIWGEQKDLWNVGKIFDEAQFDEMGSIIRYHDGLEINPDNPLLSSIALSDNLSLFAKEKLPTMFRVVPGGRDLLIKMGHLAVAEKNLKDYLKDGLITRGEYESQLSKAKAEFASYQAMLYKKIDSAAKLSKQLKRDLKSSVKEANFFLVRKSVGTLAGAITKISGTRNITIEIKYNLWEHFLQNYLNMGQAQTKKFLSGYGIKDYTKKEYKLGDWVTLKVTGLG